MEGGYRVVVVEFCGWVFGERAALCAFGFWVLGSGWELDYGITTTGRFKSRLLCKSKTIF